MAWTVTTNRKTVFGDTRVHHLKLTADAATQNVDTGLDYIYAFTATPGSLSTAGVKIYENVYAAGTSAVGYLGCSGFVSGDVLYVTVFGR